MKSKVKIYAALGLGLDLGRTGVYFEDIRVLQAGFYARIFVHGIIE